MCKVCVEDKLVVVLDLLSSRNFLKDSGLTAGQRLQRASQFRVFDVGQVSNLGERERVSFVENEQAKRLKEGHLQLLDRSLESCLEDSVTEIGLPLEFAAGIFCVVKLGKDVLILDKVCKGKNKANFKLVRL